MAQKKKVKVMSATHRRHAVVLRKSELLDVLSAAANHPIPETAVVRLDVDDSTLTIEWSTKFDDEDTDANPFESGANKGSTRTPGRALGPPFKGRRRGEP